MDTKLVIQDVIEAAGAIGATFGPHGKPVLVHSQNPMFTLDGHTVAQHLDKTKTGVALLADACSATNTAAGDGTTSTALLVKYFLEHGIPPLKHLPRLVEEVNAHSIPPDENALMKIARSVGHGHSIAEIIAPLFWKLGPNGHVKGELGAQTEAFVRPGYELGSGALLPYFLSPPPMRDVEKTPQSVILKNPLIALVEEKIADKKSLEPLLTAYLKESPNASRPLLIIIGDMERDALQFILTNFRPPTNTPPRPVFLVKSPKAGRERFDVLTDIMAITGAREVYSQYSSVRLSKFAGGFGQASEVEISENDCRIICGPQAMEDRIKEIEGQPNWEERASKLQGATGILRIAYSAESSYKQIELLAEDIIRACSAAMKHGFVPGGHYMYTKLSEACPELAPVFSSMMKLLPPSKSSDSALSFIKALENSAQLAENLLNCPITVGQNASHGL